MRTFARAADMESAVGQLLGVSGWMTLSEQDLQTFGRLTGDEHWIHVDPDRAAREGPFGGVIAHGFLILALVTGLGNECYSVVSARRWVNYGLDRVRFLQPVTPGTRLRLELTLASLTPTDTGARLELDCRLVTDDGSMTLAARWLVLLIEGETS